MLKKFLLLSAFIPSITFAASPVTVTDPGGINVQSVSLGAANVQGSSASGATDDGSNPVKIGCVFLTTPVAVTNGQRINEQCDSFGNVRTLVLGNSNPGTDAVSNANILTAQGASISTGGVKLLAFSPWVFNGTSWDRLQEISAQIVAGTGTGLAVEEAGESFANITTATTTTVKSGPGVLHKVCENTVAASASISMFNNTAGSGASIGVITNPLTLLQMGPVCATYDLYFSIGLTIVTTGAQNITVTFR